MTKDLTTSRIDRQNILNNEMAIEEIQGQANIQSIIFEGMPYLTKNMVATFFDVEIRTIERYVSENADELINNGYTILRGQKLKDFIKCVNEQDAPDINVGSISARTSQMAIFNFKAFLNIAMLLSESDRARVLRQLILDIVIDLINKQTGGGTKYINQRDRDFIDSFLQEENYRREFTDALRDCVDMGNVKYAIFTDKIYQSIFKEKAREYREILRLSKRESIRDTLYSEVLNLVASYECGLAALIKEQSEKLGRKLNNWEMDDIFRAFETLPLWKPLIHSARVKMSSRDLALRDAFHQRLQEYIQPLPPEEYQRYLGVEGQEVERLMAENQEVLKRLKERE